MERQQARIHAEQWIAAWNERNLDAIMVHYTPSVRFSAPTVISRWNKVDGVLIGRDALRQHFKRGLELAPNLYFVSDATATFDRTGPDGVLHTAEEIQAITLTNLHQEFATIVTTNDVLKSLK